MDDLEPFARMLEALQPWHRQVVLVGGWAHRLHRFHPAANADHLPYAPLVTRDADVAFASGANLHGNIAEGLQAAGFSAQLKGDHHPPISHFHYQAQADGFYVEFLSPLRGSGTRRDGSDDATEAVAGITAQKLRHLELLLVFPWTLVFDPGGLIPVSSACNVRCANPVSFLVQKLLIHKERRDRKRAQDILYIHDTIELFEESLDMLRELWQQSIAPRLSDKQIVEVRRIYETAFNEVGNATVEAALIRPDRSLSPEIVRVRCFEGLRVILGAT